MNQQWQMGRGAVALSTQRGGPRKSLSEVVSSATWVALFVVFAALVAVPFTPAWSQGIGSGAGSAPANQRARGTGDPDAQDGLGSATRGLLALQVSGAAAGPQQAMTGDATSAAYKRYTDSFTHAVPEYFQQKVRSDSSGS
ncbi:DUF3613 domain-containing protein [Robbsia sp. KACC 23696]|uniref:DUF3613 domain-containing protein n=1 Tax=Robbsia sp. KACC 23696 TaxID=3149231 RepID=UPI00325B8B35